MFKGLQTRPDSAMLTQPGETSVFSIMVLKMLPKNIIWWFFPTNLHTVPKTRLGKLCSPHSAVFPWFHQLPFMLHFHVAQSFLMYCFTFPWCPVFAFCMSITCLWKLLYSSLPFCNTFQWSHTTPQNIGCWSGMPASKEFLGCSLELASYNLCAQTSQMLPKQNETKKTRQKI